METYLSVEKSTNYISDIILHTKIPEGLAISNNPVEISTINSENAKGNKYPIGTFYISEDLASKGITCVPVYCLSVVKIFLYTVVFRQVTYIRDREKIGIFKFDKNVARPSVGNTNNYWEQV